jgi:hypothetical protein
MPGAGLILSSQSLCIGESANRYSASAPIPPLWPPRPLCDAIPGARVSRAQANGVPGKSFPHQPDPHRDLCATLSPCARISLPTDSLNFFWFFETGVPFYSIN